MKIKILTAILLSFVMIIGTAVAGFFPLPFTGKIVSDHNSNLPIKLENLRTAESVTGYTSGSGEFLLELSPGHINNDVFRLTVMSCESNSACIKEVTYSGQNEIYTLFDLTDISQQYVCWDNSLVSDPNDCPVQPEPDPEYICWDDSTVSDISLCPEEPEEEPEPESSVTPSTDTSIATSIALYGQEIEIKLDDNKIGYLIDGEIPFNNENYEVEEEVYFAGITKTSIDDDDFGRYPYLTLEEYGVEYRYLFNDLITISEISEENPLEITFLGKDLKIIEASDNEITVRYGDKITLLQGESDVVNGNTVEITAVTDNSVSLKLNQVSGIVTVGNTKTINGLEVVIDNLLYQGYADGVKEVTLIIGDKVQATYKDGDYFDLFIEDNEEYEWIIQLGGIEQYFGVWNTEAYLGIDEDDDYHALGVGDSLFLPNDYVEIQFKSVTTPDLTDLNIREKDGYLYLRGPTDDDTFSFGTKDYDRVYMDAAGIYDDDFVLITTDKVEIGDSEIYLEKGSAKIGDLTIELDLSDILFKGISFALKDETFMDYLGIIFSDPENAVEEKRGFEVLVPEKQPEVTIAFGKDILVEAVDIPKGCPEEKECTTCKTCETCSEEEACEPEIKYVDTVCPEEKICPDTPETEGNVGAIIITLIASLLVGGAGGIYFTRNKVIGRRGGLKVYRNNKGEEVTYHRHPGILSYHNPATVHRESHERHPTGQLFPHYIKEESGRWIYEK